ncbi:cytolethal distending toxin subunit B family protein [Campylobacter sp. MIT 12-8780]|uniref:cytolethal distending toxin subunit B family protein n=1 Tax=unclassified Campylobacter TaxID=2593542 RepID=UPI00115D1EC0|nr:MULTISPECIES: cytolethal distending toxin subunit B family protein [unclassified Campylobacter]NDJ27124.1 cytolethal distending toxin subunit B family protein [Campylobacter sp. MIT 19-121]TQR41579.1 cytolethal distending toxin subunit B family protein [Campylobacter sp. MIT 12-8780]
MKKYIAILIFSFLALFAKDMDDYKVASWNLQGSSANTESKWSVSIRQLISGDNAADILAVQEAGSLPHTATPTGREQNLSDIIVREYNWDLGSRSRPDGVFVYYTRIDTGANRVNLAIVSRTRADEIIILPPPTTPSRPVIGIRIDNNAFFSVHALANGGSDSVAIVNSVFEHFRDRPDLTWMIAGDFNRNPENLRFELNLERRVRTTIIAPDAPTQRSGGTLDYAIVGSSSGSVTRTALVALLMLSNFRTQLVSDHFPVNFRRFR